MALKENYGDGDILSAAAFNEVTDQVNTITDTALASIRANRNLNGGGTITVDASYNVLWSARFLVISNSRGATFGTAGYFEINCPVTGTITGVGGATNKTATAAGIPLAVYDALYYILPIGAVQTSLAANFRVASYTSDFAIPYNWVLICIRNGDSNAVMFNNGITLNAGQSLNSIHQSNANVANTLVRRDASGNFSAGTVTASTLVSNVATGTAPLTVTSTTQVTNLNAQYVQTYTPTTTAAAGSLAARDANANLLARGFIPGFTTTATAAGTTTLTIASNPIQEFTGTLAQTVVLPTTGVAAGQQYTIINNSTGLVTVQSSSLAQLHILASGTEAVFTALIATPTLPAHWEDSFFGTSFAAGKLLTVNNNLTLAGTDGTTMTFPATSGNVVTGSLSTEASASSIAQRDGAARLVARAFIPALNTQATATATTTLISGSHQIQEFTGTLTQTCVLPTTAVTAGQTFTIINNSTGAVTVQSSALATIGAALTTGTSAEFIALVAAPTTAANWHRR